MTDLVAHARSAGVRNPRLDMFHVPPTDLSMSSRRFVKISPFNAGINPVTFQVDPQEDFIDLNESFFEVELKVRKDNNTDLLWADLIGLANNLAHTLFKQINVRLNGTLISPLTDTYHYKAYIETLLNHDRDDGETILTPNGWYNSLDEPDDGDADEFTANMLDHATPHADYVALDAQHKAEVDGRVQFLDGKAVTMRFKPYLEVFHLSKLLVPGVQIAIDMYFNAPALWTIRWDGGRTLTLTKANVKVKLFLAQARVTPSVYREIMSDMQGEKVVTYPTVRGEIRTYSHPNDNRHFEYSNPFHNKLPNRLVVVLMKQTAFNGTVTVNRSLLEDSISLPSNNWCEVKSTPSRYWSSNTMGTVKIREATTDSSKPQELCFGEKGTWSEKRTGGTARDATCLYLITRPMDVWTVQC